MTRRQLALFYAHQSAPRSLRRVHPSMRQYFAAHHTAPPRRKPAPRPRAVRPPPPPPSFAPPSAVLSAVKQVPILGEVVSVVSTIGSLLGLGSSLQNLQCAPGNANWPGCAIPGGSVASLVAAGLTPEQAADVAKEATTYKAGGYGVGGGGTPGGGTRVYLR